MTTEGPLSGIRVLDLSDEATAFGARLLAELGADVIRLDAPTGLREQGPFLADAQQTESSLRHLLFNAGKRSAVFTGPAAIEGVARSCDVVIAPLRQDSRTRSLLASLERGDGPCVVDAVFRREQPDFQATDLVGTAAGGLLTLNGFGDQPPNYPAGELGYKELSLAAAQAALALVMERRRTGRRGTITVSLQEAVNFTTLQTANANWWHWQGRIPSRHIPLSPFTTHLAGDGQWVSFTVHPPNWPRYAEWAAAKLDAPELLQPEWADAAYRALHVKDLGGYTRRLAALYSRDQLIAEGQARGLLVLPVNTVADIASDPHLRARGFYEPVHHPALGRDVTLPRTPFFRDGDRLPARPAPALGEHTGEVLAESASPRAHPRGNPGHSGPPKPLEGVRILDFCWAIAGPLGTRLLADLGADVIKVESEYRPDPIRQIGVQPMGESSWNTNGQFNDCNTSKRSLVLNLNTPEGMDVVRRLAASADVVTSNYTPDRLDKWGLGYDALEAIRPGIIVANWAVMGTTGPSKDWRSYGSGIVAMCGLAHLTGFPGREPIGLGTLHTDFTVPYFGALQVMSALVERDRTGKGGYLELSQYEASVHLLDTELVEHLNNRETRGRTGNRSTRMSPHGVFPAFGEDRWVAIACRDEADWAALQRVPGLESLATLDAWTDIDAVESAIADWTSTRDRWAAADILQQHGVPASPVEDLLDLLEGDPGMAVDYRLTPLPSGVTAMVQEQPILWDGERVPFTRAPMWGEHTDEILRELGYSDDDIAHLGTAGALY